MASLRLRLDGNMVVPFGVVISPRSHSELRDVRGSGEEAEGIDLLATGLEWNCRPRMKWRRSSPMILALRSRSSSSSRSRGRGLA
jgi:hypothetical protein